MYINFLGILFLLIGVPAKLLPNTDINWSLSLEHPTMIDVDTILKKAADEEASSNFKVAVKLYEQALVLIKKSTNKEKAPFVLKRLGLLHYKQNELRLAQNYFQRGISEDSLSLEAADAYFNLALIQRRFKQKDSLFYFLECSLKIYDTEGATEKKFGTYLKAGILFKNSGNYKKAITYLLQAYDGFGHLNNPKKKATACSVIGATQRLMQNYEVALRYYKEGLRLRIGLQDSAAVANSYNSLGLVYKETKQNDSAISYFSKAIALKKEHANQRELGRMLSNLASVYAAAGDLDRAGNTYLNAVKFKRKEKDTLALLTTFNELAYVNIKKKDHATAKRYLDSIGRYRNDMDNNEVVLRSFEVGTYYFKSIGAYERALELQEMHGRLYQEVFNEKQSRQVQELQEKYESEEKQSKISELLVTDTTNSLIIANQKKALYKRDTLLVIAALLLLVFLGGYLFLKQRQKIKKKVFEYEKLKAVLQGQEMLKEEISKDLHDIIAVNYEGIRLKVHAVGTANNPGELIERIGEEIKDVNHQVRLISHRLSPLGNRLENTKLSELIISQLSEMQHYNEVVFDLELPFPREIDQMKVVSQTNFYGLLLEIVQNCLKHANANTIRIAHDRINTNGLKFVITDNGTGFAKNGKSGIGLNNIDQRAALLKGEVTIHTSEKGTAVEICFPIKTNLI